MERELLQSTSQNSCDSTLNSNEIPKQKEKQPPLEHNGRHSNDSGEFVCVLSFPGEGYSILVGSICLFRTLMTFFLQIFVDMNLKKASFGSDCLYEGRKILR